MLNLPFVWFLVTYLQMVIEALYLGDYRDFRQTNKPNLMSSVHELAERNFNLASNHQAGLSSIGGEVGYKTSKNPRNNRTHG